MTAITYADGYGRWHALVPIAALNPRDEARTAMLAELVEREWKSNESLAQASARMRGYLEDTNNNVVELVPATVDPTPHTRHFVEFTMAHDTLATDTHQQEQAA